MADFDPVQYLKEKEGAQQPGGGFDPAQYLKEKGGQQERPWYSLSGKGLVQGSLDALPVVGAGVGGFVGAPLGPLAAVGSAGLGGSMGQSLKDLGEEYLLGKPRKNLEEASRSAKEGLIGGIEQDMGGKIFGAVGEGFSKSGVKDIAKSFNRPGIEEVKAAAAKLGVKPTQGMLTDDSTVRNLENSLSQSPTIPGSIVKSEQEPIYNAMRNTSEKAVNEASAMSDIQAGRNLQKGVSEHFEKRYEPIKEAYSDIEGQTKDIPINEKGVKRIANNIRNLEEAKFEGSDANKIANQFGKWLENAENVNDIKTLKTKARQISQDKNSSIEAKQVAGSIMDKLEQAQTNTITRQAIQKTREEALNTTPLFGGEAEGVMSKAEAQGKSTGKELIGKIKDTNKQYKGLMTDAKTFGEGSGLTKANKGMAATMEDIKSAKPEDVAASLFDTGNINYMNFVKEKMPEQFEMARQQRLAEVAQKTQAPNGKLDPKKLTKLLDKMTPESAEILFGKENVEGLKNVQTLQRVIPEQVGPSGTPQGMLYNTFMNPLHTAQDVGRYGFMKAKPSFPAIGDKIQEYSPMGAALIRQKASSKEKR